MAGNESRGWLHYERRVCTKCGLDMGVMSDGAYEAMGRHCYECHCDECPSAHT